MSRRAAASCFWLFFSAKPEVRMDAIMLWQSDISLPEPRGAGDGFQTRSC
jgi:hypothetical protein